jgi:transcriptional regulator with XRE-family HTH domain
MKDRIKEIRTSLGLSQEELAKQLSKVTLGVNILEETVKMWELGSETPLPSAIEALSHLSERPIQWIQCSEDVNGDVNGSDDQRRVKVFSDDEKKNNVDEAEKITSTSNVIRFPDNYDDDH